MSRRSRAVVGMLCVGAFLLAMSLVVGLETVGPKLSRGAEIAPTGYLTLISSLLGGMGFTLAGVVTAIMHAISPTVEPATTTVAEVVELTASFGALMRDNTNKAAQRRFVFALADASTIIPGVSSSHDGDAIVIRYSGFTA